MSLAELKQLHKDLAKAIASFEDRKKSEARTALEAQAKELGYTLSELLDIRTTRNRAPAVAKYRHLENADVTWSGRGREHSGSLARSTPGRTPATWKHDEKHWHLSYCGAKFSRSAKNRAHDAGAAAIQDLQLRPMSPGLSFGCREDTRREHRDRISESVRTGRRYVGAGTLRPRAVRRG